jgi:hypothetical protein
MAKLHLNLKNMPKDTEVEVPPHGIFKNGYIYDVPSLNDDVVVGEKLDHKKVLKRKVDAPDEVAAVEADAKAAPEDMAQPAGDTKTKDGE